MCKAGAFNFVCAGLLGLALLVPRPAAAAWPADPLVNVPLCTAGGSQQSPTITSDGAGGAIVAWVDYRSGNSDIYAQRISADGTVQWAADGVALCTATGDQLIPTIVADGVPPGETGSGAIVAWYDSRSGNYDIYAQRISAGGIVQWTADGVALCSATGSQSLQSLVSDGAGGAIVTWEDQRGSNRDIYAQRISAAGAVQWQANGVALCTATANQQFPGIAPDGAGGAIVAWNDSRSGAGLDIYAQRISAAGAVQWPANGVALCSAAGDQWRPTVASDDADGGIVSWHDYRGGTGPDIYCQRISAGGAVQWTANGVALCTATGDQSYPRILADGAGGAIVTWFDYRSGDYDVYAQRVSAGGAVQWTADGVALCTATGDQSGSTIAPDGAGGAIVAWHDKRNDQSDIYAQRISAGGAVQWMADGVALCSATGNQLAPGIVSDEAGGAIIAWYDYRNGSNNDIYAQAVQADGELGSLVSVPADAPLALALEPLRPNPARGGALTVCFTLPSTAAASLELLDVAGRRIAAYEVGSLGAGRHTLGLRGGQPFVPGLYLVCLRQGTNTRVARVAMLR